VPGRSLADCDFICVDLRSSVVRSRPTIILRRDRFRPPDCRAVDVLYVTLGPSLRYYTGIRRRLSVHGGAQPVYSTGEIECKEMPNFPLSSAQLSWLLK
jgi:hypothetical protein